MPDLEGGHSIEIIPFPPTPSSSLAPLRPPVSFRGLFESKVISTGWMEGDVQKPIKSQQTCATSSHHFMEKQSTFTKRF